MIKVLVIEDEPLVARDLVKLTESLSPPARVEAVIDTVEEAVKRLREEPAPDLLFCDIQLSDGVSFDIFRKVKSEVPIIFTTAYDEYAIRAFKLNSIDYLLKPIDRLELERAWQKFLRLREQPVSLFKEQMQQLLAGLSSGEKQYRERFMAHSGNSIVPVNIGRAACFVREELILLVTTEGHKLITDYHSLEELEEIINPARFFRANRQYIINMDAVESYRTHYSGKLELKLKAPLKEEVTVSREKAGMFKRWFEG